MELNQLSSKIIGAAITVHKERGPGLLESVYHACLLIELRAAELEYPGDRHLSNPVGALRRRMLSHTIQRRRDRHLRLAGQGTGPVLVFHLTDQGEEGCEVARVLHALADAFPAEGPRGAGGRGGVDLYQRTA